MPSPRRAHGNASCTGAGSSSIAPGQGFGFPGERAEVAHFGIETAADLGLPPGQIAAFFAHQHGTAAECFPEGVPGQP